MDETRKRDIAALPLLQDFFHVHDIIFSIQLVRTAASPNSYLLCFRYLQIIFVISLNCRIQISVIYLHDLKLSIQSGVQIPDYPVKRTVVAQRGKEL